MLRSTSRRCRYSVSSMSPRAYRSRRTPSTLVGSPCIRWRQYMRRLKKINVPMTRIQKIGIRMNQPGPRPGFLRMCGNGCCEHQQTDDPPRACRQGTSRGRCTVGGHGAILAKGLQRPVPDSKRPACGPASGEGRPHTGRHCSVADVFRVRRRAPRTRPRWPATWHGSLGPRRPGSVRSRMRPRRRQVPRRR